MEPEAASLSYSSEIRLQSAPRHRNRPSKGPTSNCRILPRQLFRGFCSYKNLQIIFCAFFNTQSILVVLVLEEKYPSLVENIFHETKII